MKITFISKLFFAFAMFLTLSSFTDKKEKTKEEKVTKPMGIDASVFQLSNSYKVKLAVDKADDSKLRIYLKDKGGKVYFSEQFAKPGEQYRRVFNFDGMNDGKYYFEMYYNKQKLVKEVNLQTSTERLISFE